MKYEKDIERLARVLCVSQGIGDPDAVIFEVRTPWQTHFGAFVFVNEWHKPEPAWWWFSGVAAVLINEVLRQPLKPDDEEPTPAEQGMIDPELPGFDIAPPADKTEAWREQAGLT